MQTPSAPQAAAETDAVSPQTNLLALGLAIELARSADSEGGSATVVRCLHDFLDDEAHQIGGGPGLRRAVEELQRALRQAGEAPQGRLAAVRGKAGTGLRRCLRSGTANRR